MNRVTRAKKAIQAAQNAGEQIQHKKRPWASVSRKPSKEEVDIALIKTANSLVERATAKPVDNTTTMNCIDEDEDTLFCRSVAQRI